MPGFQWGRHPKVSLWTGSSVRSVKNFALNVLTASQCEKLANIIVQWSPPPLLLTFDSEGLGKMCSLSSSPPPTAKSYSVIAMVIQISGLLKHVKCTLSPIAKQVPNEHQQENGGGWFNAVVKGWKNMNFRWDPCMHYPQLTAHVSKSSLHWHFHLISIHCGIPTTNNVSPTTDFYRFIQSERAIDFPPSGAQ